MNPYRGGQDSTTETYSGNAGFRVLTEEDLAAYVTVLNPPTVRLRLSPFFVVEGMEMPNRWWRFWQWALLGWTWERM